MSEIRDFLCLHVLNTCDTGNSKLANICEKKRHFGTKLYGIVENTCWYIATNAPTNGGRQA